MSANRALVRLDQSDVDKGELQHWNVINVELLAYR